MIIIFIIFVMFYLPLIPNRFDRWWLEQKLFEISHQCFQAADLGSIRIDKRNRPV